MLTLCKIRKDRRRRSQIVFSLQQLEQITDIFFADSDMKDNEMMQGNEVYMTEDDKFMTTTGKFDANWNIVSLRTDLRPKKFISLRIKS